MLSRILRSRVDPECFSCHGCPGHGLCDVAPSMRKHRFVQPAQCLSRQLGLSKFSVRSSERTQSICKILSSKCWDVVEKMLKYVEHGRKGEIKWEKFGRSSTFQILAPCFCWEVQAISLTVEVEVASMNLGWGRMESWKPVGFSAGCWWCQGWVRGIRVLWTCQTQEKLSTIRSPHEAWQAARSDWNMLDRSVNWWHRHQQWAFKEGISEL